MEIGKKIDYYLSILYNHNASNTFERTYTHTLLLSSKTTHTHTDTGTSTDTHTQAEGEGEGDEECACVGVAGCREARVLHQDARRGAKAVETAQTTESDAENESWN